MVCGDRRRDEEDPSVSYREDPVYLGVGELSLLCAESVIEDAARSMLPRFSYYLVETVNIRATAPAVGISSANSISNNG